MKSTTAWACTGPITIGAYAGIAMLVRLRIADDLPYRSIYFITASFLLLCLIGAIYLARRNRTTIEVVGFWVNICCVLLWTITILGFATFPSQK